MELPPLDKWIKERIGDTASGELSRENLTLYQLMKLNETLSMAIDKSRFYRERLGSFKGHVLSSTDEISRLPFTGPEDLIAQGQEMLCVSAAMISRIVTLETSGSTGKPKRVYFTEGDQELTVDYFHHGMQNLVDEKDRVLILLPCKTPGCVGDLLAKGLGRLGSGVVPYGFPASDPEQESKEIGKIIIDEGVTSIVGSPQEVLRIAEDTADKIGRQQIRTVLLSTDYIPDTLREKISELWGSRVFEHYGMTEMGLGGAVSCHELVGYHPRENDLYFEIINPETGKQAEDGEYGEVVFTTLTRGGMPLIRYRTGDISRWIPGQCPCGSILKRMDKVLPRNIKKGNRNTND
ncbi:hypothetical protein MASR2M70_05100 [Bacillota bacterium]